MRFSRSTADFDETESSISVYEAADQRVADELHQHNRYELVFVTKGQGRWQIGDRSGPIRSGMVALIRPGLLHAWTGDQEGAAPGKLTVFGVAFARAALPVGVLNLREAEAVRKLAADAENGVVIQAKDPERVLARIRTIQRARGLLRVARLYALLELLAQQGERQVVVSQTLVEEGRVRSAARLEVAKRFIGQHCHEPIGRSEVAKRLGMEANAFSRFFHAASGMPFSEFLANMRIQTAARLLVSRRDTTVAEVARRSGFRNLGAFNQQFRKRLGTTPRAYRKNADCEILPP